MYIYKPIEFNYSSKPVVKKFDLKELNKYRRDYNKINGSRNGIKINNMIHTNRR